MADFQNEGEPWERYIIETFKGLINLSIPACFPTRQYVALFQGFRGRFVSFGHLCEHLFNPLFRQPRPPPSGLIGCFPGKSGVEIESGLTGTRTQNQRLKRALYLRGESAIGQQLVSRFCGLLESLP
jgi:hypothetical protein